MNYPNLRSKLSSWKYVFWDDHPNSKIESSKSVIYMMPFSGECICVNGSQHVCMGPTWRVL